MQREGMKKDKTLMAAIFTGQFSTFSLKGETYPNIYTCRASYTTINLKPWHYILNKVTRHQKEPEEQQ